jgi:ubiquinone/menaquinone biosynthesis C-methylase UbiE
MKSSVKSTSSLAANGRVAFSQQDTAYRRKQADNQQYWSEQAVRYGPTLSATASSAWVRAASVRRLRELLKPDDWVLEIGCGNTKSVLQPLSRSHKSFGIDLSFEMLAAAEQERTTVRGLAQSDACKLPFADQSFDVVYTSRCVINIQDPEMQVVAIQEAIRTTKPSGVLVLIENFEEPVRALGEVRARYGHPQICDEHNVLLNLASTISIAQQHGWSLINARGNTIANHVSEFVRASFPSKVAAAVDWMLWPFYALLTRIEDQFFKNLPLIGKDVMLVFEKRPA